MVTPRWRHAVDTRYVRNALLAAAGGKKSIKPPPHRPLTPFQPLCNHFPTSPVRRSWFLAAPSRRNIPFPSHSSFLRLFCSPPFARFEICVYECKGGKEGRRRRNDGYWGERRTVNRRMETRRRKVRGWTMAKGERAMQIIANDLVNLQVNLNRAPPIGPPIK